MADDVKGASEAPKHGFGTCCEDLKDAMSGGDFDALISVGDDGILYLSVGLVDMEDEEPGLVDHPLFFCPFCGTKVQDPTETKAKLDAVGATE